MDWKARLEELGGLIPVAGGERFIPVTESELAEVERAVGTELPEPFRAFLSTFGGSSPRKMLAFKAIERSREDAQYSCPAMLSIR